MNKYIVKWRARHGGIRKGLCSVAVGTAITLLAPPGAGREPSIDPLTESVHAMLQGPAGELSLRTRITTVDEDGTRSVSHIRLLRLKGEDRERIELTLQGGRGEQAFCMACRSKQRLISCGEDAAPLPPVADADVPGTALPWSEVIGGFCTRFRVLRSDDVVTEDGRRLAVFDLHPETGKDPGRERSRLYMSTQTGLPVRAERFDGDGRLLATIEVLRARRTSWGPSVSRFIYIRPRTTSRVLVEVQHASVLGD